ncbi:MAG: biotin--protein ligase [Candidatus Marsarchaeota archaeon]|jgi:lipoate-protein ligase A|nr:biotin--protein ligase [Candidatus Marsarchaeota archaeon]
MEGSAKQKVPGGKLISVRISFDTLISRVEITGDFFLHPEEALSCIEGSMAGVKADEPEQEMAARVRSAAESHGIEMIGITPEAVASTVKMAIRNGMESNKA